MADNEGSSNPGKVISFPDRIAQKNAAIDAQIAAAEIRIETGLLTFDLGSFLATSDPKLVKPSEQRTFLREEKDPHTASTDTDEVFASYGIPIEKVGIVEQSLLDLHKGHPEWIFSDTTEPVENGTVRILSLKNHYPDHDLASGLHNYEPPMEIMPEPEYPDLGIEFIQPKTSQQTTPNASNVTNVVTSPALQQAHLRNLIGPKSPQTRLRIYQSPDGSMTSAYLLIEYAQKTNTNGPATIIPIGGK